jgi:hypothetical protein
LKPEEFPNVSPEHPIFLVRLGELQIHVKVTAKAARKLRAHQGTAVLTGNLVSDSGRFHLDSAGFQLVEPKPPAGSEPSPVPEPRP